VLTANNADQAIEILESGNDITTIFTDIEMPGSMNGLKLAAAVRDRWPPVNIVITTGKARPPNDRMPTNSRFVAKPYQKADSPRGFAKPGKLNPARRSSGGPPFGPASISMTTAQALAVS
jgi:DNA-binding LytR/AlgR family response regulator